MPEGGGSECRTEVLAKVVAAIGEVDFPASLAEYCEPVSGMTSTIVALFKAGSRPRHLFNTLKSRDEATTVRPYIDGPYLLDPFYALMASGADEGLYRLEDVAPDEFRDSDYFNEYYRRTRLKDETGLVVCLDAQTHMLISFGLREGDPGVCRVAELEALQPLVSELCRKHWEVWLAREPDGAATFAASLDNAYRNFGRDLLTDREREVMILMLRGHSSKSMAHVLDISPETIKIHRRNLYSKVDVGTQSELFSVFLEALASVPIGSTQDPLERYQMAQSRAAPTNP